jgi:hypothetical protein
MAGFAVSVQHRAALVAKVRCRDGVQGPADWCTMACDAAKECTAFSKYAVVGECSLHGPTLSHNKSMDVSEPSPRTGVRNASAHLLRRC